MKQQSRNRETDKILHHITVSKDEILTAIKDTRKSLGRPTKEATSRRGPKDTRMMKIQRTALIVYVTIEKHLTIDELILTDAYHVWNMPENSEAWNEAAKRKDARRGYKDYNTLYSVVKTLAQKRKLNIARITAV